ncbi:MAG: VWA domain-containing protein, partial [Gemmatimonadaceae bacterium]
MTFDHPIWLIAIVVAVPALLHLLRQADRRRSAALARFGELDVLRRSAPLPTSRWRMTGRALLALACAALLVAIARPRSGSSEQTLHESSHDVLFVLDLSRSMQARDALPSRLDAAKQAALAIARRLSDDRVGLVIFGGSAFLQLPLTLDHSALSRFVDQAAPNQIPSVSTNLEAAADVAASSLVRSGGQGARVAVFLTDGEDVAGKLEGAIGALKHDGIHGFVVGIGTTAGARIPDVDSAGIVRYHRDRLGNEVVSHLEEQNLRDIARETGGVYAHWSGDASVTPIVAGIAQLATGAAESRARAAIPDRFQWPLALAILALLLESALGLPWRAGRAMGWRRRLAFRA